MSFFKTHGISIVIFVILFGVSLLIYKLINSYSSKNQSKEKVIKEKRRLFRNIIDSIWIGSLAIVMVAPVIYIFDLVFRLLFPSLSPKDDTVVLVTAVIYVTIDCITNMVLFMYAWKWLKKNLQPIIYEWDQERKKLIRERKNRIEKNY
jgi:hypothetical protein